MGTRVRKNLISVRSSYSRNEDFGVLAMSEVVNGFESEAILDSESSLLRLLSFLFPWFALVLVMQMSL